MDGCPAGDRVCGELSSKGVCVPPSTATTASITYVTVRPSRPLQGTARLAENDHDDVSLVTSLHSGLMSATFDDLEELGIWLRLISVDVEELVCNPKERCVLYFVIAYDAASRVICGGASVELYKESGFGLVAYLAVDPSFRQQGIAKRLMELADGVTASESLKWLRRPRQDFVILVSQARDEGESQHRVQLPVVELNQKTTFLAEEFDPLLRQRIWSSVGFQPINFTIVCPGRLRGHRHSIAVRHFSPNDGESCGYPKERLESFLVDLFSGILAEEGNFTDSNNEISAMVTELRSAGNGVDERTLQIGSKWWL